MKMNQKMNFIVFLGLYSLIFSPIWLFTYWNFNASATYGDLSAVGRFAFDIIKALYSNSQTGLLVSIFQGVIAGVAAIVAAEKRNQLLTWVALGLLFIALILGLYVDSQATQGGDPAIQSTLNSLLSSGTDQEKFQQFIKLLIALAAAQIGVLVGLKASRRNT